METGEFDNADGRLDQATADRLARLRTMPLDTRSLEAKLRGQIPMPTPRRRVFIGVFRPLRAVAASLIILGVTAAVLLSVSGGPALASAAQMAQMHYDVVSGKTPVIKVDSIDEASKILSGQWPSCPQIPKVPDSYEMACCMKSVKGKKVACMLLKSEGTPITMTVANATDMAMPSSPTMMHDGVTYHVQSSGALNMAMTQRNGKWVCLIGEISSERLMAVMSKLRF
jgi:hypothetical protein